MSRVYSDEGIVLARKDYSEADRILVLFTKTSGRISLIAKGVRKPKSRKRGHLEVFNYIKFSAAKGKGLDIITEAEIIDSFSQVRENLKRISVAYFFAEVIGRTTRDSEKNVDIYELLLKHLKLLKTSSKLKSLRTSFTKKTLETLGFWPKGRELGDADRALESIIERKLSSVRVGKKLLR